MDNREFIAELISIKEEIESCIRALENGEKLTREQTLLLGQVLR